MAVSYTPLAAWNARIAIGPPINTGFASGLVDADKVLVNFFAAYHWSVNTKTDDADVTSFESGGFEEWLSNVGNAGAGYVTSPGNYTVLGADISVEAFWDASKNPISSVGVLKIVPGTLISLGLYINRVLNRRWTFPSVKVSTASVDAEVKGGVKFNFSGKGDGVWQVPQD